MAGARSSGGAAPGGGERRRPSLLPATRPRRSSSERADGHVKTVSMRKIARHVQPARASLPGCMALCFIGLALVSGCGASAPALARADLSIEHDLLRGVREIRATRDRKELHAELVHLIAHLRRAHGTTASARRGRELALQGFEATLKGIRSQLDFSENDSGEVAAATRDAKRADRYLRLGANLLRAAGQSFGVRIGALNGY